MSPQTPAGPATSDQIKDLTTIVAHLTTLAERQLMMLASAPLSVETRSDTGTRGLDNETTVAATNAAYKYGLLSALMTGGQVARDKVSVTVTRLTGNVGLVVTRPAAISGGTVLSGVGHKTSGERVNFAFDLEAESTTKPLDRIPKAKFDTLFIDITKSFDSLALQVGVTPPITVVAVAADLPPA